MSESIKLADIHYEKCQQMRAGINQDTVADYRELFKSDFKFPPIIVFFDGSKYWLADGFHRVIAANELGRLRIAATVTKGSQRDAILYACGANSQHGLRRSNADKRRAVETLLADEEWGKWSSRKIAEAAGVSHVFVENIRGQLETVTSSLKRVGHDGKERAMPKSATVTKPTWDDEPEGNADVTKEAAEEIAGGSDVPETDFGEKVAKQDSIAKDLVPQIFSAASRLDSLLRELKGLKDETGGEWLDITNIETQLMALKHLIRSGAYWRDCGCEKGCKDCRKLGWLSFARKKFVEQ